MEKIQRSSQQPSQAKSKAFEASFTKSALGISPPEPISQDHDLSLFDCRIDVLNQWLKRRALKNELIQASRTFVISRKETRQVIGYYCLAVGSVNHENSRGKIKRNMPNPVPIMILGRLAVDQKFQGKSIGSFLLRDAILRTIQASKIAGIKALTVHALNDEAAQFYRQYGFQPSPLNNQTLHLFLDNLSSLFSESKKIGLY